MTLGVMYPCYIVSDEGEECVVRFPNIDQRKFRIPRNHIYVDGKEL